MAITKRSLTRGSKGFAVTAHTADPSGTEELVAAPGAGKSLFLEYASITRVVAGTMTIGEGETSGRPTNRIFVPMNFTTTSGSPVVFSPRQPIKLTANTSLTLYGKTGVTHAYVEGYTE